ncbi:MAG: hypothetical protein WDN46_17560 [Methylocella sp.]
MSYDAIYSATLSEVTRLHETIAAKDAELAALQADHDKLSAAYGEMYTELALMREALEPFARTPWLSEIEEDDLVIYSNGGQVLTWDDLRRARAALQAVSSQQMSDANCNTDAARDVIAERKRQVEVEGWTPEHDNLLRKGELALAAAAYAFATTDSDKSRSAGLRPLWWPWSLSWWKPTTRRRDLVKAGALILAEIERLDRAALQASKEKA